ncbi:MAG TPA: SPOR domain-containing protein, partial [Polyangiaceae bacterium]|nr:SPOR domain-containing protein [Polyangiaceae bacterium]
MSPINVRNLEQIQEADSAARPSRLSALVLAALASAAIVTATVVMAKRKGPAAVSSAKAHVPAESLERSEVTFPGVLSDGTKPTTALAAVKDARGRLIAQSTP